MRILKFGGNSLSSPEKVQNICKYIKKIYKNDKNLIIVVSAMGNTTDNLISEARKYSLKTPPPRELAKLLSTGETQSASLLSIALFNVGIPAKSLDAKELEITTFGDPLNSKIAYINKAPIIDCFNNNYVAVVAGFQGVDKNGEITLLGRGGSDTTASAMGAIFEHNVEIYSNFNGVFSGDPKLFSYKKIKQINYDAMTKLAASGAKVLEQRAVTIAKEFKFDIISKSANSPDLSGTVVSGIERDIISITSKDDLCEISIVYTNNLRFEFIIKNVIYAINNLNFYNFKCENGKISFLAKSEDKEKIIEYISKKLKLINNDERFKSGCFASSGRLL